MRRKKQGKGKTLAVCRGRGRVGILGVPAFAQDGGPRIDNLNHADEGVSLVSDVGTNGVAYS